MGDGVGKGERGIGDCMIGFSLDGVCVHGFVRGTEEGV